MEGMIMDAAHELEIEIRDTTGPNKDRIMRTRALVGEMTSALADQAQAEKLLRDFNWQYLNLQMATLAADDSLAVLQRNACLSLARQIWSLNHRTQADTPAS
jgi:hypothetical protein